MAASSSDWLFFHAFVAKPIEVTNISRQKPNLNLPFADNMPKTSVLKCLCLFMHYMTFAILKRNILFQSILLCYKILLDQEPITRSLQLP